MTSEIRAVFMSTSFGEEYNSSPLFDVFCQVLNSSDENTLLGNDQTLLVSDAQYVKPSGGRASSSYSSSLIPKVS